MRKRRQAARQRSSRLVQQPLRYATRAPAWPRASSWCIPPTWCAAKRAFRANILLSGHVLADDPAQQESSVQEVIVEGPSPP